MNQYIVLVHGNQKTKAGDEEWKVFLECARNSGMFRGGSILGNRDIVGEKVMAYDMVGYMRFDASD